MVILSPFPTTDNKLPANRRQTPSFDPAEKYSEPEKSPNQLALDSRDAQVFTTGIFCPAG
jgi:hypothetical protein